MLFTDGEFSRGTFEEPIDATAKPKIKSSVSPISQASC